MKIVHVINSMGLGGIQRQMIELIKILSSEGHYSKVLVYDKEMFFSEELNILGTDVVYIDRSFPFIIKSIYTTISVIKKYAPDIIHIWNIYAIPFIFVSKLCSHNLQGVILNGSLQEAPIKIQLGKKIISYLFFKGFKYTQGNAKACIDAFGMSDADNIFVIKNGFDIDRIPVKSKTELRNELKFLHDNKYVCMVSALSRNKDHKTFIDAAVMCLEEHKNLQFLIVGDGPKRGEIEEYLSQFSDMVKQHISLLGNRRDVEKIFKACDVSVLASASHHGEGISNSIVESLACGTPVIATDNGGSKEIIKNDMNGFIVPSGDSKSISCKLLKIINDESILQMYSSNGRKLIRSEYSLQIMGNKFIELYTKMLNK